MEKRFSFLINIPTDVDGYALLQCSYCGSFFKLRPSDFEDDGVLFVHCPTCGLISENYATQDVLKYAEAHSMNIMEDIIGKEMKRLTKGLFKNSNLISVKMKVKKECHYEKQIHSSIDSLSIENYRCCNKTAKIKSMLKMVSSHCPFCGVIQYAND